MGRLTIEAEQFDSPKWITRGLSSVINKASSGKSLHTSGTLTYRIKVKKVMPMEDFCKSLRHIVAVFSKHNCFRVHVSNCDLMVACTLRETVHLILAPNIANNQHA